MERDCM